MMPKELSAASLRVDRDVILAYAEVTNDYNPIHIDPEFAKTTPFGDVIAHGTMSVSLIWQMIAASFDPQTAVSAELDIRFVRPVRVGDVVTAGGSPDAAEPGRYQVFVRNQNNENVIEGWISVTA